MGTGNASDPQDSVDRQTCGDHPQTVSADVTLNGRDWRMRCRVSVPAGPTRVGDLLPLVRALSDTVVGEAVRAAEQSGERVSCRKGCGACCRHLVAVTEAEARRLRGVVDAMPEPRRGEVLARFDDARRRLTDAGLLGALEQTAGLSGDEFLSLAFAYFAQRIACPFLDAEESCSIHPERPIACREYLVVSPAENCSHPTPVSIRRLNLPLPVFNAAARWQVPPSKYYRERWVPLILAPAWATAHPDDPPPRPGLDLLRELLEHLSETPPPGADE